MNYAHLMISAVTGEKMEVEENTRDHLTTREMYAVRPQRSVLKGLLNAARNKLSRR